ncbi:BZ3500_MvSof-1268-A1-R1_Chr3-3g06605 [Microbotryum saponariae]|uniref:BZ3500_MvSof-1268-A1-R1_Chr3-3g06605 protein n=1 Tax=Microbotryum saponariae TaxID=289078 RepID=A0A2X0NAU1_9BASI|nr:BZ3500_MvSof-1268-A1-R1_Chr3-3g06605 [Microbotryum saponariae]SDA04572.1 BZ3501_MvSof-1269-A2-R1_Chr3-2g06292 [Microbotryum saponariae]
MSLLRPRILPRTLPRTLPSRVPSRTLWTCSTYLSDCAEPLLSELKRRHPSPSTPPSCAPSTLFCLSKSTPFSYLSEIHSHLTLQGHRVLGALTETPCIPSSSSRPPYPFSLSLATYTPSSTTQTKAHAVYSTLLGRPNISLGREHKSPRSLHSDDQDELSEAALRAFLTGEQGWSFGVNNSSTKAGEGKAEGKRWEGLEGIDPAHVKQLIYITSDRSTPLLQLLSTTYANTQKLGLTASSTPFHSPTGQPFTLITPDGELHSTGAVAIAIVDETAQTAKRKGVPVGYEGLVPFGLGEDNAFEVTSSKGNIILTLSSQNAARLLLNAVNALQASSSNPCHPKPKTWSLSQSEKDQPFYAAVFPTKPPPSHPSGTIDLSAASFVCRLMAGDPSRGAMSLDTERDLKKGDWVVLMIMH